MIIKRQVWTYKDSNYIPPHILSEEMTWFSNLIKMDENKDDKKGKTVCILNIIDNIY